MSITTLCSFHSLAGQKALITSQNGLEEITHLKDEIIEQVNHGGPGAEIGREISEDDIDFNRAYKVYSNSELFNDNISSKKDIEKTLKNGSYVWEIPIFLDDTTILVDIDKVTSISDDIPEDVQETLKKKLGKWTVGAIYVYDEPSINYQKNVEISLSNTGLASDSYNYEFVRGLPGIRYAVAIVFDDQKARFIIPAEASAAAAFQSGSEAMEYIASPSETTSKSHKNGGFPVYNFEDVAEASKHSSSIGLGGGIGIKPYKAPNIGLIYLTISLAAIGLAGTAVLIKKHTKKSS